MAVIAGSLVESEGADAVARLPELLARDDANVWVDLTAPSREHIEAVGDALRLHI